MEPKPIRRLANLAGLAVALAVACLALGAGTARASYLVTLQQEGANVVATGSGSINLTDLSFFENGSNAANIVPSPGYGIILLGPTTLAPNEQYAGFTGPGDFGIGALGTRPTSGSGNIVGIFAASGPPLLFVPSGYLSGSSLGTTTDTWDSTTLAGLDATPGTYVWTWGAGVDADSFTLQVGAPATAPEPGSLVLLLVALGALVFYEYRRRFAAQRS